MLWDYHKKNSVVHSFTDTCQGPYSVTGFILCVRSIKVSKHSGQQSCPQLGGCSVIGPLWGAGQGLRVEMTFKQRWIRVHQSENRKRSF